LADPKKIIDIINYAILDPMLATNALAEIFEQLRNQDKYHILFTLDGYNKWLQPSSYESFRYVNDPSLKGYIPPKDLSLVKLLN
jgi:hypothetical protein